MTPPGHDEFIDLPGLFVLGALAPDDRARFEAHLRECPICAEEVRSLVPVVEGLARAVPLREPPASLRTRVLEAVGAGRRRPPAALPASAAVVFWSRVGWLAAAAALVAAIVLGYLAASRQERIVELEARLRDAMERLTTAERQVADARRASDEQTSASGVLAASDLARIDLAGQPAAPGARGRAFWSRSRGMVFNAVNLPPLPAGRTYQVWVLTSASPPISAGVFAPDASGSVRLVIKTPEDIPPPTRVAVTLEPAGGVPAPTGDMYLAGAVAP
jgi:anti-sigma-K factor RskA